MNTNWLSVLLAVLVAVIGVIGAFVFLFFLFRLLGAAWRGVGVSDGLLGLIQLGAQAGAGLVVFLAALIITLRLVFS